MTRPIALNVQDVGRILEMGPGEAELDLSLGRVRVRSEGERMVIGPYRVPRSELLGARHDSALYGVGSGRLEKLQIFHRHLYKLCPTCGHPALEIDGIRMHRTKDMNPEEEAEMKVDRLRIRKGERILDICTGLGYSSQAAARRGAFVLTMERHRAVLELARRNPCSQDFFEFVRMGTIAPIICDASRCVGFLPSRSFDGVLHDPPSFPLAGELYSLAFYRQLRRVIKESGILLHYTGQPGSKHRRLNLGRSVAKRLRQAGFATAWDEHARSVLAEPVASVSPAKPKRDHVR